MKLNKMLLNIGLFLGTPVMAQIAGEIQFKTIQDNHSFQYRLRSPTTYAIIGKPTDCIPSGHSGTINITITYTGSTPNLSIEAYDCTTEHGWITIKTKGETTFKYDIRKHYKVKCNMYTRDCSVEES